MDGNDVTVKVLHKQSGLIMLLSVTIVLITVVAAIFAWQDLRKLCVCISNWMAWSWIVNGVSVFIALMLSSLTISQTSLEIKKILFALQSIAFIVALGLLIVFASKLLHVI